MNSKHILNQAKAIEKYMVEARRLLHQIPELGGEEEKTRAFLLGELQKMKIETITYPDHWGITAIIRGEKEGKTIALRADMDGLPVEEKTGAAFSSLHDGKMHACGHDAHMAIALGAAKLLQTNRSQMKGNVKIFFEPMEETTGGAKDMVAAGCMENPKVEAVIGLHMCPDYPVGTLYAKAGAMSGASDDVSLTIKGLGAHGAYPHRGVDAIVIAAQVISALQTLVSRNTAPLDSAVLSLGTIKGGVAGNVICDEVNIHGTLRTLSNETRAMLKEKIVDVTQGIAQSMGGSAQVMLRDSYEPIVNDPALFATCMSVAEELVGSENIQPREHPSLGVESFGFFLKEARGCYYDLGSGVGPALHSCDFTIDEKVLPIGAALQAAMALTILEEE